MGGDGGIGIGDGTGNVGDMGSGGYGSGIPGYGSTVVGIGDSFGYGGAIGPGAPGAPGANPSWNNSGKSVQELQAAYGGLGTAYPTPASPAAATFNYPMPQTVHDTIYGLPYMQAQRDILGNMSNMSAFRSAVLPEVQGVMKTLGRSGLPSSSYADRAITDTMGSLYNKWMWNVLTGYQNIGAQMPTMMNQWYQPYDKMLAYLGS